MVECTVEQKAEREVEQMRSTTLDVLVIGAGQAGLAAGYFLKQQGVSFAILDKGEEAGDVWRNRYDSLVLFTPRWYSSLPGLPLPGDANGYATKDEVADYLKRYAAEFSLPVHLKTEVFRLEKTADGFTAVTNRGDMQAKQVIAATGAFQKPMIPRFADDLPERIRAMHTSSYRNASQLQEGSVLIVGGGNSGAQIAVELAAPGNREVFLSLGHPMKFFPLELFGKSVFWWGKKTGFLDASLRSIIGAWLQKQKDPIFGTELKTLIHQGKVITKPRTIGWKDGAFAFEDGTTLTVQNVIWATGFVSDYSWIQIPGALDTAGHPIQSRGVSPVPGLYYLGLPWMNSRGSALIGGVGADAEKLVQQCLSNL